jgi:hypothetical protein
LASTAVADAFAEKKKRHGPLRVRHSQECPRNPATIRNNRGILTLTAIENGARTEESIGCVKYGSGAIEEEELIGYDVYATWGSGDES